MDCRKAEGIKFVNHILVSKEGNKNGNGDIMCVV